MDSAMHNAGTVTGQRGGDAASTSRSAGKRRRTGVSPGAPAAGQRKGGGPNYTYVYEARRPLTVGETKIEIGEVVPGAEDWPRIESWVRTGKIIRRRVRAA